MSQAADAPPEASSRGRSGRRGLAGMCIAHLLADGYASFPSPLLSGLAPALGVSYASVSALLGLNAVSAATANIALGLAIDRRRRLAVAVICLAVAITVVCMSLIGVITSYWLLAAVMAAGLFCCGAYHPPAFSLAGEVYHPHRHRGVAIVMTTGIVACGLGPVFVSQVVHAWGLRATPVCIVPGLALVAVAALLLRGVRSHQRSAPDPASPRPRGAHRPTGRLVLLFVNTAMRIFALFGVLVVISYLVQRRWGMSVAASGWAIGSLQLGAGLGGLIGAALTRTGREQRTIFWCAPLSLLLLVPMALFTGLAWYPWLFLFGLAINGPGAVVIGLGQRVVPRRSALVSGLLVGPTGAVAGALAALTTPRIVEHFGDLGQIAVMAAVAVPLLLSWAAAWRLPRVH